MLLQRPQGRLFGDDSGSDIENIPSRSGGEFGGCRIA